MIEKMNDSELEQVSGGAAALNTNTTDWQGAHWQPPQYADGTTFVAYGFLWYKIKAGDALSVIAQTFGTTVRQLQINNPSTIQDVNKIFVHDALIIRRA